MAAYLLKTKQDGQHEPHTRCDLSESDPEKLSSTDNEDEEVVVDGQYCKARKHEAFTKLRINLFVLNVSKMMRVHINTTLHGH